MCGCPKYLSYPVIFMVLNLSPVLETWSLPVANLPADNLPAATFQQHNLPTEDYKLEATNPNPWTTILFNKYSSINNRTYNYEFMSDNDERLEDYTSEHQQTISDLYSPITSENNFLPDSLNLPLLSRLKHRNKAVDRMIGKYFETEFDEIFKMKIV